MATGTLITSNNFNQALSTLYTQTIGAFTVNLNGFPSQFVSYCTSTKPSRATAYTTLAKGSTITISSITNIVGNFLKHLARLRKWVAYNYHTGAYGTYITQLGGISASGKLVLANINTASGGKILSSVANGGYNTCIINRQIYQNYYSQQDTKWDTQSNGLPDNTEKIMYSGLVKYFEEIKSQYDIYISEYTVICITASCHDNCHSNCHSNRGRR